jgi:hypothetical protein
LSIIDNRQKDKQWSTKYYREGQTLQWPKDNRQKDKQWSTKYYREGQTLQWPKDNRQKDKQWSTKYYREGKARLSSDSTSKMSAMGQSNFQVNVIVNINTSD